jgi:TRAP-type transport system periplasmic protein
MVNRRRFVARSAAALATAGIVRAPAKAAQFEFRCANEFPADHPTTVRLTQMWAAVEKESGGRVRTQFFPNSQLGTEIGMWGQLRVGALHFFLSNAGVLQSLVPVGGIAFLGFAFKDQDQALHVMDGPLGAYVRQETAAKGLYALRSIWNSGMIGISSRPRPIRTPDDLRGFKVRTATSKISVGLQKALGADPVSLNFAEVYTALQTKLIDGAEGAFLTIESQRLFEVEKYQSVTNHSWGSFWLLANGDAWKSLPPDLQNLIERIHTKYVMLERQDTRLLSVSLADKLSRQGMILNTPDQAPFRGLLSSYYKEWAGEFGSTAWGILESSVGRKLS